MQPLEAIHHRSALTLIHARTGDSASPVPSARTLVAEEFPGLEVRVREVEGPSGEVLINAAISAEVLFIGGPAASTALGAVGYDVLLNISGPTIVVPPA